MRSSMKYEILLKFINRHRSTKQMALVMITTLEQKISLLPYEFIKSACKTVEAEQVFKLAFYPL